MATQPLYTDELLEPISAEQPGGTDLQWSPEWDQVREARRSDDPLDPGKWAKKERKVADWRLAQELTTVRVRQQHAVFTGSGCRHDLTPIACGLPAGGSG